MERDLSSIILMPHVHVGAVKALACNPKKKIVVENQTTIFAIWIRIE